MEYEDLVRDLEMSGWERQLSKIEQEEDLQNIVNMYRGVHYEYEYM